MNDGFLVVNKPVGVTSFSMVGMVRRLTGLRRVGHAGTLDPLASGVLPVAIGAATRLIEYTDDEPKVYLARVRFGVATDTFDAEGAVVSEGDASGVTSAAVESALTEFVGAIAQVPPVYSALKLAGKPLYRYAREGAQIELEPRMVRVHGIALHRFEGDEAEIEVACGKGTYIRSLAHDLGARLGCGAHLASLVRTRTAGFSIEEAHSPEAIGAAHAQGGLAGMFLAPDRAVERRPAVILEVDSAAALMTGSDLDVATVGSAALCRAYSVDGSFLGVLERRDGATWHPRKMVQAR